MVCHVARQVPDRVSSPFPSRSRCPARSLAQPVPLPSLFFSSSLFLPRVEAPVQPGIWRPTWHLDTGLLAGAGAGRAAAKLLAGSRLSSRHGHL